jgi:hypothetical protein
MFALASVLTAPGGGGGGWPLGLGVNPIYLVLSTLVN